MTPTAIACAIRDSWIGRSLLIASLAVAANRASAQQRTSSATQPAATVLWDSLYRAHRFFELRDSVRASRIAPSPATRLYAGLVAHAFNDNDAVIASLAPLVDGATHPLTAQQYIEAVDALGDSYRRVFRYSESATTYRRALRLPREQLNNQTRARFSAWAAIAGVLAEIPPQRVAWSAQAQNTIIPNDSVLWTAAAAIAGDTISVPFAVDPAAPISVLDSTTAARHHVRIFDGRIRIKVAGREMPANAGVIVALAIGPATIFNVPVLIVPDDSLRSAYRRARVGGVIGLPLVSAMGAIVFLRDGHIALSSPGTDNDTSGISNVAIADGQVLIAVQYMGHRMPLVLDASMSRTIFFPPFLEEFPHAAAGAALTTYVGTVADGGIVSLPAYVIPSVTLSVNGRTVGLASVDALMQSSDVRSQLYLGVLGQDALRLSDLTTLDFGAMSLRMRDEAATPVLPQIVYPTDATGAKSPITKVPQDLAFIALLFALFVVPRPCSDTACRAQSPAF